MSFVAAQMPGLAARQALLQKLQDLLGLGAGLALADASGGGAGCLGQQVQPLGQDRGSFLGDDVDQHAIGIF